MKKKSITDLLIFVVSAELTGAVSALLSGGFTGFYDKYIPPPLLPPTWLFLVVWVILYALMGISAYLVYSSGADSEKISAAMKLYAAQLFFNFIWSIIFFRFEAFWLAALVIIILLLLILAMISAFKKVSPAAAYINIPYLVWVAFAAYLNIATAILN